jgi:hypothetical protein
MKMNKEISDLQFTIYDINFAIILLLPFVLFLTNSCFANELHTEHEDLQCSDCHTMHYSEGGQPVTTPSGESYAGPSEYLIRADSINLLCLSCHDSGTGGTNGGPVVRGVAAYESSVLKRAGGFFQRTMGIAAHKGHSLGVLNETAPGSNPPVRFSSGLTCVSCHDPHGNDNYRSLKTSVGNGTNLKVSYINGVYSRQSSIFQNVLQPASLHYSTGNIRYTRDDNEDGLSHWCQGCHSDIHSPLGRFNSRSLIHQTYSGSSEFYHPTMGVTMSQAMMNRLIDVSGWFNKYASRVPVVSPSNQIPGTSMNSDNQVGCMTCHKAHGSNNKAGLIYDDAQKAALEDGKSLNQTCQQCHSIKKL